MILADTSVVIDYTLGKDPKLQTLMLVSSVAICGVTRAEVLSGARRPGQRSKLLASLGVFQFIPMPDTIWDLVGENLSSLGSRGITVSLADVAIATLGIENNIEVWARDRHFLLMQPVLPLLKLFQEPP